MKKPVRIALEAVVVVLLFHFAQSMSGVVAKVLLILGFLLLIIALVDLLRTNK